MTGDAPAVDPFDAFPDASADFLATATAHLMLAATGIDVAGNLDAALRAILTAANRPVACAAVLAALKGAPMSDEAPHLPSHRQAASDTIAFWLGWVAERFGPAESDEALLRAVGAIRTLINLLDRPDCPQARQVDIAEVRAAIDAAEPFIVAAAEPLEADHVVAGLDRVRALLSLFGRDLGERITVAVFAAYQNDIDHAALIADELDAVLRRRLIAARALAFRTGPVPTAPARTMH